MLVVRSNLSELLPPPPRHLTLTLTLTHMGEKWVGGGDIKKRRQKADELRARPRKNKQTSDRTNPRQTRETQAVGPFTLYLSLSHTHTCVQKRVSVCLYVRLAGLEKEDEGVWTMSRAFIFFFFFFFFFLVSDE